MLTVSVLATVAVAVSVELAGAASVAVLEAVAVSVALAVAASLSDGATALSVFLSPQEAKATAHAATPPIKRFLFSVFMIIF
jgi:hypothetical protein